MEKILVDAVAEAKRLQEKLMVSGQALQASVSEKELLQERRQWFPQEKDCLPINLSKLEGELETPRAQPYKHTAGDTSEVARDEV